MSGSLLNAVENVCDEVCSVSRTSIFNIKHKFSVKHQLNSTAKRLTFASTMKDWHKSTELCGIAYNRLLFGAVA